MGRKENNERCPDWIFQVASYLSYPVRTEVQWQHQVTWHKKWLQWVRIYLAQYCTGNYRKHQKLLQKFVGLHRVVLPQQTFPVPIEQWCLNLWAKSSIITSEPKTITTVVLIAIDGVNSLSVCPVCIWTLIHNLIMTLFRANGKKDFSFSSLSRIWLVWKCISCHFLSSFNYC